MPKQRILNCPMKFNSKTLEADGFIKKETCLCDEETAHGGGRAPTFARWPT